MTPFEGVYGHKPPTLQQHLPGEFVVAAVAEESGRSLPQGVGGMGREAAGGGYLDDVAQFPLSNLADKVCSIGGGIVSTAGKGQDPGAVIVYSRRKRNTKSG
ncbi:hypothetical protein V2J09_005495 [Rumex salicifolius]